MVDKRVIARERGEALAAEYGIPHIQTSAKDGTGVEECLIGLAKRIKFRLVDSAPPPESQGDVNLEDGEGKKGTARKKRCII